MPCIPIEDLQSIVNTIIGTDIVSDTNELREFRTRRYFENTDIGYWSPINWTAAMLEFMRKNKIAPWSPRYDTYTTKFITDLFGDMSTRELREKLSLYFVKYKQKYLKEKESKHREYTFIYVYIYFDTLACSSFVCTESYFQDKLANIGEFSDEQLYEINYLGYAIINNNTEELVDYYVVKDTSSHPQFSRKEIAKLLDKEIARLLDGVSR